MGNCRWRRNAPGAFIRRTPSERTTLSEALDRYLREVVPTKKASTQAGNRSQAEHLRGFLGQQDALLESLPLSKGNWITCGNSLKPNWLNICPPTGTGND